MWFNSGLNPAAYTFWVYDMMCIKDSGIREQAFK